MFNKINKGVFGNIIDLNKDKFDYILPLASTEISIYKKGYKSVSVAHSKVLPLEGEYYRFKPKFTSRIKNYLKNSSYGVMVVLTDTQIAECKIDLDIIKDLDTLPKIVYARGPKS